MDPNPVLTELYHSTDVSCAYLTPSNLAAEMKKRGFLKFNIQQAKDYILSCKTGVSHQIKRSTGHFTSRKYHIIID